MINWKKTSEELPHEELMAQQGVLILLNNKAIGVGYFFYENGRISAMKFNGAVKRMNLWGGLKPTHWAMVDLPEDL